MLDGGAGHGRIYRRNSHGMWWVMEKTISS
jgi:hypothetical protein